MATLVLLSPFGVFFLHFVYFVVIWYIFSHFGILQQENLATLIGWKKFWRRTKRGNGRHPSVSSQGDQIGRIFAQ
jgi:hypothetical protein